MIGYGGLYVRKETAPIGYLGNTAAPNSTCRFIQTGLSQVDFYGV